MGESGQKDIKTFEAQFNKAINILEDAHDSLSKDENWLPYCLFRIFLRSFECLRIYIEDPNEAITWDNASTELRFAVNWDWEKNRVNYGIIESDDFQSKAIETKLTDIFLSHQEQNALRHVTHGAALQFDGDMYYPYLSVETIAELETFPKDEQKAKIDKLMQPFALGAYPGGGPYGVFDPPIEDEPPDPITLDCEIDGQHCEYLLGFAIYPLVIDKNRREAYYPLITALEFNFRDGSKTDPDSWSPEGQITFWADLFKTLEAAISEAAPIREVAYHRLGQAFKKHRFPATASFDKGEPVPDSLQPLSDHEATYQRMPGGSPVQMVFQGCTVPRSDYKPFTEGERCGMRLQRGKSHLSIYDPDPLPVDMRNAKTNSEALQAWVRARVSGPIEKLDDMAWDVASNALTAFYARTEGKVYSDRFALLSDDYFDWRGTMSSHRGEDARKAWRERIEVLCSIKVDAGVYLYATDPKTGRKPKTFFGGPGPFLIKALDLYRDGQIRLDFDGTGAPDGYMLTLGEWAKPFVEECAMLSICMKRLATYDTGKKTWERRIGWYLVFQMGNQGSKMTFQKNGKIDKDGKVPLKVTPQHPLRMKTILDGASAGSFARGTGRFCLWSDTAKIHPGTVIKQFLEAIENLKNDGVIGGYSCMDAPEGGPVDGSELSQKGRLPILLERRWLITPGPEQTDVLQGKAAEAMAARKRAADRKKAAEVKQSLLTKSASAHS